ncbi:hypothetical protein AVEN_233607-1 [Araneus ventricosus]|uniref:MSP domain-containing protein n=1 Tax=Araneus ventricosus TaxID=182803 RepID=A0A4Y2NCD1_ARAVE|nr:hypothetical protein AVEN_73722-1 [Araneus ventricosus]GBN36941.1 hypothetical protein AVEN_233607-1 [Araneus ventricosus]
MNVPDNFHLPFCPSANVKIIMENKNSSWIDFDIETTSPQTVKMKPEKGCIGVGREVQVLVSRPKILPSAFSNEYLIFKFKYCSHNKLENAKLSTLHQSSEEQVYIINIITTNRNICSKQTYCACKIGKSSATHNNQLYDRLNILSSQKSANSLSTDKTRLSNGTKNQRKSRHPFTFYQPFSNETIPIENETARRSSTESFRRISPLKHTAGDDKNVSAINKYIEIAKIKNTLLKRNNVREECCGNAIDLIHCYPSNEETLQKIENHQQFDERNDECNFKWHCELHDDQASDICHHHECDNCSPPLEHCYHDHEDVSSNESNDECCIRHVNDLSKKTHNNEDAEEKRRKKYISTEDVTKMAQKSVIKFICFPVLILILTLGIVTFHSKK